MPFMIGSAALNSIVSVEHGGIRMDATGTVNGIFVVGIDTESTETTWAANGAPASSSAAAPAGLFDFTGTRNAQITVYATFRQAAIGNRAFAVSLSNNTTGHDNSPLGGNNAGRIFRWLNTPGGSAGAPTGGNDGIWTTTNTVPHLTGTAVSDRSINTLTDTHDFLRRTFIGISAMNTSGADVVITGIRIEYVD
jgi:hypothetical protein